MQLFLFLLLLVPEGVELPAYLVITCPEDVELRIQGELMRMRGMERRVESPPLPMGQAFLYDVQALRRGQVVAARRVEVRGGQTTQVRLMPDEECNPSAPPGSGNDPVPKGSSNPVPNGGSDPVPTVGGDSLPNFGIDLGQLQRPTTRQRAELNGQSIPYETAAELLRGDTRLPDPGRPRLTIIGTAAQRQAAKELLHGPLRELSAEYVIQDYAPDHWAVTRCGFVTSGQPTIYAQASDGRVLFRQDDLSQLRTNLEAVRKPSPRYQPDKDPDYRRKWIGVSWEAALPWVSLAVAAWFFWKAAPFASRSRQ